MSMLRDTLLRLREQRVSIAPPLIVCSKRHATLVAAQTRAQSAHRHGRPRADWAQQGACLNHRSARCSRTVADRDALLLVC
jgi:hypothetical protein